MPLYKTFFPAQFSQNKEPTKTPDISFLGSKLKKRNGFLFFFFFKHWAYFSSSSLFLLAYSPCVLGLLTVLKLWANNGELDGPTEDGSDGFASFAFAGCALPFQLRRQPDIVVADTLAGGERVAAQSGRNSLGSWAPSCCSAIHDIFPVFIARTLVSSP